MTPIVSILIPSRNRTELLEQCVKSWKTLAANPDAVEIVVRLHFDDAKSMTWAASRPYGIRLIAGENYDGHISMGMFLNCLAACSTGDWLLPSSDDFECLTQDWERAFEDASKNPRTEFLMRHFETVNKPGERPPIITRGFYNAIGGFGHTSHADVYLDSLGWRLGINQMNPLPIKVINHLGPPPPPNTWEAGYAIYSSSEIQQLLENDFRKARLFMDKP
jgi:hypothetical protein